MVSWCLWLVKWCLNSSSSRLKVMRAFSSPSSSSWASGFSTNRGSDGYESGSCQIQVSLLFTFSLQIYKHQGHQLRANTEQLLGFFSAVHLTYPVRNEVVQSESVDEGVIFPAVFAVVDLRELERWSEEVWNRTDCWCWLCSCKIWEWGASVYPDVALRTEPRVQAKQSRHCAGRRWPWCTAERSGSFLALPFSQWKNKASKRTKAQDRHWVRWPLLSTLLTNICRQPELSKSLKMDLSEWYETQQTSRSTFHPCAKFFSF